MIVEAAKKINQSIGFPWQLIAAQGCLESNYGQSVPVDHNNQKYSYNTFGIKGTGPAGSVACVTSEYVTDAEAQAMKVKDPRTIITTERQNGKVKVLIYADFKAFNSVAESLDWYMKLMQNPRYQEVWKYKNDPVGAAHAVQRCGYATDPRYADKLIALMRAEHWIV